MTPAASDLAGSFASSISIRRSFPIRLAWGLGKSWRGYVWPTALEMVTTSENSACEPVYRLYIDYFLTIHWMTLGFSSTFVHHHLYVSPTSSKSKSIVLLRDGSNSPLKKKQNAIRHVIFHIYLPKTCISPTNTLIVPFLSKFWA